MADLVDRSLVCENIEDFPLEGVESEHDTQADNARYNDCMIEVFQSHALITLTDLESYQRAACLLDSLRN